MSQCCSPKGYRWIFSERAARAEASRYRKRGLDATSRQIADALVRRGVGGRTVLEIGGGIGAIQLELLKAGASRAVSIELTPTYEEVAWELLHENGLADRAERRVFDFARDATSVEPADIVIMNRVICCYPDMPRLSSAAAEHARETLAMSMPRREWWTVGGLGLFNAALWITRREFHVFLHRPQEIRASVLDRGLREVTQQQGALWRIALYQRAAA